MNSSTDLGQAMLNRRGTTLSGFDGFKCDLVSGWPYQHAGAPNGPDSTDRGDSVRTMMIGRFIWIVAATEAILLLHIWLSKEIVVLSTLSPDRKLIAQIS